jgi:two-component system chemotaxis sensor kinase CheA
VLRQGEQRIAMLVDRLVGEQELTLKKLPWPLRRVRNLDGAAVLEAGETVIILNPLDLLKTAVRLLGGPQLGARLAADVEEIATPARRLLVADDSLTTRTLERSILESAGYDVVVAGVGAEALRILREQDISLLVSDVDMPNMDGFSLTAAIRADPRLRQIPVILVTSLEASEHWARGVEVGADAYIVKRGFDQGQLLEAIGRLL